MDASYIKECLEGNVLATKIIMCETRCEYLLIQEFMSLKLKEQCKDCVIKDDCWKNNFCYLCPYPINSTWKTLKYCTNKKEEKSAKRSDRRKDQKFQKT